MHFAHHYSFFVPADSFAAAISLSFCLLHHSLFCTLLFASFVNQAFKAQLAKFFFLRPRVAGDAVTLTGCPVRQEG